MIKKIKYICSILFAITFIIIFSKSYAATATISASKTNAIVGDSVTVTVNINAASWNLNVSGATSDSIVGYNGDGVNQTTTKSYTVKATQTGAYVVNLNGDVTDGNTDTNSKISSSVTINVSEKTAEVKTSKNLEKSSNAYLTTLGVTPKEYDFSGFNKNTTEYSVTVPSTVDSLKVIAKAAENGTVKITGNSGFEAGSNNKISVVVTSQDGSKSKTYTIKVTKLAIEDDKPGNLIEDDEGMYLTSLSIKDLTISPKFAKEVFAYSATLEEDLDEVEVLATANSEDIKIEITGNKELVSGENTINIVLSKEGSSETVTYQIKLTKPEKEEQSISASTDVFFNKITSNISKFMIIAVIIIVVIIVGIIVVSIMLAKENKRLEENDGLFEKYENDTHNIKRTRPRNTRGRGKH